MKKLILLTLIFVSIQATTQAQTSILDTLLKENVSASGNVNYAGLKKSEATLDTFLSYLEATSPKNNWSASKTKAFWINAYNAYTVKLILKNYPLKSITSIKKGGKNAWEIKFAKVGGKTYSLNHIEHQILRKKYNDPKIHVGVNCASGSCPQLGNFAFTEANYEAKSESLMKKFINDSSRNKISKKKASISKIFEWFKEDFTKDGTLIDFINKYSTTKITKKTKIKYLKYNWNLNGK